MGIEEWEIETAHSGIYFSVRHMVVGKVRGSFKRWSATLLANDEELDGATLEVVIDASSIQTGADGRDAHLRSSDFLDARRHPNITFKMDRVRRGDERHLCLTGTLSIRGVQRDIVLEVESTGRTNDEQGYLRAGFTAKTSIDRRDFGITWNRALEAGGVLVGDRVDIEVEIEAVRPRTVDRRHKSEMHAEAR